MKISFPMEVSALIGSQLIFDAISSPSLLMRTTAKNVLKDTNINLPKGQTTAVCKNDAPIVASSTIIFYC